MQRLAHGTAAAWLGPAVLAASLAACERQPAFVAPPDPKVTAASPLVQPVQDEALFTGQTAAILSADLVARVAGFLREADVADGADVQKGQVLFQIEREPYQAQLDLAQANLDQQQAVAKSAENEFARQETLRKQLIATQTTYDSALASRDSARGAVAAAQANLKTAEINLGYTRVEAPFSGRMGRRLVDPGNLVGAGGPTKLANLQQIDRLYATFTINERDLPRLQQAMQARGLTRDGLRGVPVFAGLANEPDTPHEGHLDFVDAGLDPATGTLQARAVFDNAKRQLVPGLFVRLRIPLGPPEPASLVPSAAISVDQVGPYLLTVDAGGTVALRRVALGPQRNGLQVVASGLVPGDRVVIDGLQNAVPGRRVTVLTGTVAATLAQSN
ncbi:efflux RND transporter periplasmic adaptor subunit [Methylobacterium nigriterrae]|uniref:efflux RND transporter periplasmic adaptor subunit n=1 Tax=Methylobacterium nigriterrae TaxID=3127512 RepID=UPI00301407F8